MEFLHIMIWSDIMTMAVSHITYSLQSFIAALALDINIKWKWILIFSHFSNFVNVITKHPLTSNLQSLETRPTSNTSSELVQDSQEDMGCGQSKEPLTNQKPASELLTNHIAMEAVALKMVESVNKIERVEEEEENGDKDDIEKIEDEEDVSNILNEDIVVTVEAAQDIKDADEVIKEAEMMESMKESTNEGKVSDILTNQKPGELIDDIERKDDPPPTYQSSEGEKKNF